MRNLILIIAILSSPLAQARSVCKMKTGYGTFVGYGSSETVAFEKAAERCYDSLGELKMAKGKTKDLSIEQGEAFIDYCVNLECE